MKPQFLGVRSRASNISTGKGAYTVADFYTDFPQFTDADGVGLLPSSIAGMFVELANASITPDKYGDYTRYAEGLFVAHKATLFLQTYAPHSESGKAASDGGMLKGTVKRATLGDASVEYDTAAVTSATMQWGDLNETAYGQQLAGIARTVGGIAGSYII